VARLPLTRRASQRPPGDETDVVSDQLADGLSPGADVTGFSSAPPPYLSPPPMSPSWSPHAAAGRMVVTSSVIPRPELCGHPLRLRESPPQPAGPPPQRRACRRAWPDLCEQKETASGRCSAAAATLQTRSCWPHGRPGSSNVTGGGGRGRFVQWWTGCAAPTAAPTAGPTDVRARLVQFAMPGCVADQCL
jgi:hypothetical protein